MPRHEYVKAFYINNAGIEKVALGQGCRLAVLDLARKALAHAESIAPEKDTVYRTSFRIRLHIRRDWPPNDPHRNARVCADVANVARHAAVVEWGLKADGAQPSERPGRHRVLGRTFAFMISEAGKRAPKRLTR